jgi:hypothetical protein
VVVNNVLFHKGTKGSINVSSDSLPGLRSDYNVVGDRLSPDDGDRVLSLSAWRSATGLDRHSLASRPQDLFVNFESNDFHLRDGSPAIDAADLEVAPRLDIEGNARPVGVRPDAGAYEAKSGASDNKVPAAVPG